MSSLKPILLMILLFLIVGIAASLPITLMALLFGGGLVARDTFIVTSAILGGWFPLRLLLERLITGKPPHGIPEELAGVLLSLAWVMMFVIAPLLYVVTLFALLTGLITYAVTQSLWIALALGLLVQAIISYRAIRREAAQGKINPIFEGMQSVNIGAPQIVIEQEPASGNAASEGQEYLLIEPTDTHVDADLHTSQNQSDAPQVIIIDSD